ncbi:MAG: hypothetical protein ACQEXN_17935 [Actinomycetota bacterium]
MAPFDDHRTASGRGVRRTLVARTVEEATPEVMFTNPQHERTQAFLHAVLGNGEDQIGTR